MDDFIASMHMRFGQGFIDSVLKSCEKMRDDIYKKKDADDIDTIGGSPNAQDLAFLWMLAFTILPKNIIEIGSWIGTSAAVLASGMNHLGKVYTCDKRNFFVSRDLNVRFYCLPSDEFLHCIASYSLDIGICFIDASLMPGDAEKIIGLFGKNKIVVVIHDMDMHNGVDNMHRIVSACTSAGRNIDALIPKPGGYDINSVCGLVREK